MTSKNLLRIALASVALAGSSMAFAADAPAAAPAKPAKHQNHHCKKADGTMDMDKTHKACVAEKGKWVKDAPAADAAPAASAAPKK
ncbi:MAG: hypothetical protein JO006_17330 [Paucibacter sp.]|nr:hypothetical protein [Roseateles sp.]